MKEQILELREVGKTYNEIVDILGCSKSTVSYHCGNGQKEKSKRRLKKNRDLKKEKTKNKIVRAYEMGYRVNEEGNVEGLRKNILQCKITNTYYSFTVRISNKFKTIYVHRLQAYQKYKNEMFFKGIEVRHKNGNSLDNTPNNILIGTHSDNMMDRTKEDRILNASNPTYNHKEIIKDRTENKLTYKELMIKYNISSKGTVSFIINKSLKSQSL
jgi:hypothetical protein